MKGDVKQLFYRFLSATVVKISSVFVKCLHSSISSLQIEETRRRRAKILGSLKLDGGALSFFRERGKGRICEPFPRRPLRLSIIERFRLRVVLILHLGMIRRRKQRSVTDFCHLSRQPLSCVRAQLWFFHCLAPTARINPPFQLCEEKSKSGEKTTNNFNKKNYETLDRFENLIFEFVSEEEEENCLLFNTQMNENQNQYTLSHVYAWMQSNTLHCTILTYRFGG